MALITSILTGGTNNHETTSEEANTWATDFVSEGIANSTLGNTGGVAPMTGGLNVNAQGTPDMTVAVASGVCYVQATPTSQASQMFRVYNNASSNVTISANSSGSTKYDWLYVKLDATNLNTPNSAGDNAASLVTSRSSSASSDDGTPPTYGYPIAVITVANGATSITNSVIRDIRGQATLNTGSSVASSWTSLGYTPNTITYNGNRSYSCVFNSTDLTGTVSNGMRLKLTRTVTAPTQCADLESGSSQYFSKTSPAGMTFTDDFTCMAWVKLESYGAAGGIIARRNADTEGWSLSVNTSGQIELAALRIASNNAVVSSYQSIPLNKWVHVAASYDLSGTTAAVYIDGVEVPSLKTVTGTCTALVQGTTALVVGALKSAGTNPFDGKIAQAAVFSSVLSASTVRSYASQTLSGSESTLVSAYSFNNSINDLNANANNLTANGGALATNTDSPFGIQADGTTAGTTEYAIITKTAFSTNTTLTVQVPEGCAIPTSGGVSAVSYSTQATPYGFPRSGDRWEVKTIVRTNDIQSSPVSGTWYNMGTTSGITGGDRITLPVGVWRVGYQVNLKVDNSTNVPNIYSTLSTANNTESDTEMSARIVTTSASANSFDGYVSRQKHIAVSSETTYYLNSKTATASATSIQFTGSTGGATVLSAELAYL